MGRSWWAFLPRTASWGGFGRAVQIRETEKNHSILNIARSNDFDLTQRPILGIVTFYLQKQLVQVEGQFKVSKLAFLSRKDQTNEMRAGSSMRVWWVGSCIAFESCDKLTLFFGPSWGQQSLSKGLDDPRTTRAPNVWPYIVQTGGLRWRGVYRTAVMPDPCDKTSFCLL